MNIDGLNREAISTLITEITECSPRVIGLNVILETLREKKIDLQLADAIKNAGNIVLVNSIENNKLISSHPDFSNAAVAQGLANYGYSDNGDLYYEAFESFEDKLLWSLPVVIVAQYNADIGLRVLNEFSPNKEYHIEMTWSKQDLEILNPEMIDCARVQNKIILLGDLGPTTDPEYIINSAAEKEYGTVVLANIIGQLLERK